MSEQKSAWCVFSIANDYDQPGNNLEIIFSSKPSFQAVAGYFNVNLDTAKADDVKAVLDIYQGKEVRIGNADFRLQLVAFDKPVARSETKNEVNNE